MTGYTALRDTYRSAPKHFRHLDTCQLVKHALAMLAQCNRTDDRGRQPILMYLYAEPSHWPDDEEVPATDRKKHREEIAEFHERVRTDAVRFVPCSYQALLSMWQDGSPSLRSHAEALLSWAKYL